MGYIKGFFKGFLDRDFNLLHLVAMAIAVQLQVEGFAWYIYMPIMIAVIFEPEIKFERTKKA